MKIIDYKPKPISQDSVDKIPFIDCDPKTLIISALVFVIFSLMDWSFLLLEGV